MTERLRRILLPAAAVAVALSVVVIYAWLGPAVPLPSNDAARAEDWCAPGLELVAGGGCFASAPTGNGSATALLVYLHGRYSPQTVDEELDRQTRVARLGTARGFAVLALRGVRGECSQPEFAQYWCWPSNERNAGDGAAFVARWEPAIDAAKRRAGPGPSVLLGFSNGAYFATLVATRALSEFDAIAVAHGGPVQPTHAAGRSVPMLLITADEDASDPEMQRLDSELTRERWPHAFVARAGGHALPDWDIDMALTFFVRTRSEKWPLTPALQVRAPRPPFVPPDADASSPAAEHDDASLETVTPAQPLDE